MTLDSLLALRGQPPEIDAATAEAVALDLYGLAGRATPLEGERDRNFRLETSDGRRLVLKFIDHEADDVVVDGQSAALGHIAEQDAQLPVPRVLSTRDGAGLGFIGAPGLGARGRGAAGHAQAADRASAADHADDVGRRNAERAAARGGVVGAGDDAARRVSSSRLGGTGRAGSCRVRLMTYLPGRLVQDLGATAGTAGGDSPTRRELLRSVGSQVARLDRALTGFFHPALAQPIAWDVRRAPTLLPILPQVQSPSMRGLLTAALDPIQQLLRQMRGLRSQAIHGDCHGRNLLANDDGNACVGIIDLGDMIHASLALEIGVTMAEFLTDGIAPLDMLPELLAGYAGAQPLERADVEALYDLIGARIAIGVLIHTWRVRNAEGAAGAKAAAGASGASAASARPAAGAGGPSAAGLGATAGASPRGVTRVGADANASLLEEISARALDALASRGKDNLTQQWLDAAGIASTSVNRGRVLSADLLLRRHNALGANAELSYDRPLHLVRGEGVWVYASDAERLLDVYNNVPHVGHAHPTVVAAIANQARRIASNTRYLDTRIIEYVERLTATLPSDLDTCLFVNSGSEANDIAWRIAKSNTGNSGALVMTYAYHGITDAVTALSPAICAKVPPHVEQLAAPVAPANANAISAAAAADVEAAISRLGARGFKPAALMIDSALTSTGIFDPAPTWIAPVAEAVRKSGGLIIGDEVQFGLGRSGTDFWGFARRGYHPDIVTLGKPVGNGYPLGVVITRREILEKFHRDTGFFSTFGGNPIAGAAGLAVLDVLERERLPENARSTGDYFISRLRELKHPSIREVRGRGLLIGVEVTDRALAKRLVNGLRDRGVLIGSEGPQGKVLKLRPPMPFRPEHVDIVVVALTAALSDVHP